MRAEPSGLPRTLAFFLAGVSLLAMAGLIALEAAGCRVLFDPSRYQPAEAYGLVMIPLNNLGFAILGALIIARQPGNRIGWIFLVFGSGLIVSFLGSLYGTCSLLGTVPLPYGLEAFWLESLTTVFFVILSFFPWVFPDGDFLSPAWRRTGLIFLAAALAFSLLGALWPGQINLMTSSDLVIENPFALPIEPSSALETAFRTGSEVSFIGIFLMGIFNLILRWRQAEIRVRQQIKWPTYFLASSGLVFMSVEIIGVNFYPEIFDGWFYFFELLVFWLGLPVALGFAIFRFRLYDIDLIIRRTLSYGVLTAILAAVYFGAVVILQRLLLSFSETGDIPLVTVISTLAIAALFNPMRTRVQDFIDRRFYRSKYDAQKALADFAQTTRAEVDMDALSSKLVQVVAETMQPETVQLRLKTPKGRN